MKFAPLFVLVSVGATISLVAACDGDDDVTGGEDSGVDDGASSSGSSSGRPSSSSGGSSGGSSTSSSSGSSTSSSSSSGDGGSSSSGDAGGSSSSGDGGGGYPHVYGDGETGDDCFEFGNRDCQEGLRCECAEGDCTCEPGVRGEGALGDECNSGNDCGSSACSEDTTPHRCSEPCETDDDCAAPLPICVPFLYFCGAQSDD